MLKRTQARRTTGLCRVEYTRPCPFGMSMRIDKRKRIRVLYHQCPDDEDRSVQLAIALIQGKWKIGILSNLQRGPVRLSQLRRMFPQASKKMLAQQLREMERDGLIIRTDLSGRLRHVEYSLSEFRRSCGIAAHQHFDRMGLTICIIAAKPEAPRSASGSIGFGPRDCESSPLEIKKILLESH